MKITERRLTDLTPYERNPRKNDSAVDALAASIEEFGFKVPILVDEDGVILAGHTRLKAAKKLGLKTVPVIEIKGLDEDQKKQYRIIDNKVGELSSWDYGKLFTEIEDIRDAAEIDIGALGMQDLIAEEVEDEDGDLDSNLDEGAEVDLSQFDDESFSCECPYCGFRFNE